jgi:hypothetical protein
MSDWSSPSRPEAVTAYLAAINAGIPLWLHRRRAALRELADGLDDAITDLRGRGLTDDEAANRAVTESGPPSVVADAFTATLSARHARHTTLALLASGPCIGALWLVALVPGQPPTTLLAQIPPLGPVIFASIVISTLTLLATGPARLRPAWIRQPPHRLAALACACAVVGDLLMLGTATISVVTAPSGGAAVGLLLSIAVALSMLRIAVTQRVARRDLVRTTSGV